MTWIWVFNGNNSNFPSAVFSERKLADAWINKRKLSGVLTAYPLDVSVYDWALGNGYFKPKRADQESAEFMARFSCANQPHVHYEDGIVQAE